jgi:hypothetical protein
MLLSKAKLVKEDFYVYTPPVKSANSFAAHNSAALQSS